MAEDEKIYENEQSCDEYYANEFGVSASNMDFILTFSRTCALKNSDKRIEKSLCRIFASPQCTKALYIYLTRALKAYETENGEIKIDLDNDTDTDKKALPSTQNVAKK